MPRLPQVSYDTSIHSEDRRAARAGRRLAVCVLAVMLASCGGGRTGDIAYAPSGFTKPDPVQQIEISQDYRLGPSDVLNIVVYRAPDLSGDLIVDALGNVTLPLIGAIKAQGYTTAELSRKLAEELGRKYYENPDVKVTLKESAGQKVTIDGSVQQPGSYSLVGRTTLMQAVALAKGASEDANLRRVVVFRNVNGQRMAAAFDLKAIRNNEMTDPEIYGSDIIIVDGNSTRAMWRDIIQSVPMVAMFGAF